MTDNGSHKYDKTTAHQNYCDCRNRVVGHSIHGGVLMDTPKMSQWQEIQTVSSKLLKNDPNIYLYVYDVLKRGAKRRSGFEGGFDLIEAFEYEQLDPDGNRILDNLGQPCMITQFTATYEMPIGSAKVEI